MKRWLPKAVTAAFVLTLAGVGGQTAQATDGYQHYDHGYPSSTYNSSNQQNAQYHVESKNDSSYREEYSREYELKHEESKRYEEQKRYQEAEQQRKHGEQLRQQEEAKRLEEQSKYHEREKEHKKVEAQQHQSYSASSNVGSSAQVSDRSGGYGDVQYVSANNDHKAMNEQYKHSNSYKAEESKEVYKAQEHKRSSDAMLASHSSYKPAKHYGHKAGDDCNNYGGCSYQPASNKHYSAHYSDDQHSRSVYHEKEAKKVEQAQHTSYSKSGKEHTSDYTALNFGGNYGHGGGVHYAQANNRSSEINLQVKDERYMAVAYMREKELTHEQSNKNSQHVSHADSKKAYKPAHYASSNYGSNSHAESSSKTSLKDKVAHSFVASVSRSYSLQYKGNQMNSTMFSFALPSFAFAY